MPLPASPINLTTQRLEQIRHNLHFVDHHKAASLFIKIQFRFLKHPTVSSSFHVEIDGVTDFRDLQRQCRLADLPWPKKDGTGLDFQGLFESDLLRKRSIIPCICST